MRKLPFLFVILIVLGSQSTFAQAAQAVKITIPNVAMLRLLTSPEVTGTLTAPGTAGDPIVGFTNNTIPYYLQYSSVVAQNSLRKITVQTSQVVAGLFIKLTATTVQSGGGDRGTSNATATPVVVTGTSQSLIKDIGSCYTDVTAVAGSALTYNLTAYNATNLIDSGNYANLRSGETTVTLTYTLADQ